MSDERKLAEKAIESGFFGQSGLLEEEPVRAPEKYDLVRCLGQGGSGVVWLARDRPLDRLVALKFLGDVPPSVFERFRREARFTARLDSPSIVRIYELDEFDGRPFIAMEYVDGGNLDDAQLDHRELARVLREVSVALERAHAHGIVHRDIKPGNVLLDSQGRAYLTDFGIARDLSGNAGITLSSAGQVMGTPACMPPEQARGDQHAVDARSDVYAVGATLFYKLTGRWPFQGDSVVDVLHAVIHDQPPFARSIRMDVPRALEAITHKCLQKEREERYGSMRELVEDFDRFLQGTPVRSESSAWFRKLVRVIRGPDRLPAERPAAAAPDPYWTVGMEVARELAAWDTNLYRVSRNLHRAFEQLDRIIDRLGDFLAEQPDAAWARFYRGMALLRRDRLEEALEEMEQAVDRVGHLAGASFELGRLYLRLHLRLQRRARGHLSAAGVEEDLRASRGRLRQAALAFEEARRLDPELPTWQLRYADAVARLAENDFEGCIAECDRTLADDPDAEEVWKLRGDALRLGGGDPFESYGRALEIRRSYYQVCLAQAEAWICRDRPEEAGEALRHALVIHPELLEAEVLLARTHLARFRAGAGPEVLTDGLATAARCLEREPGHSEAHVTRAELQIEAARSRDEPGPLEEALVLLRAARSLPGCQNRVLLVDARARLERARQALARGEDATRDLEAVLAHRADVAANVPDSEPWDEVFAQAEALRP